ncbi:MAG: inorganic phosphate transporter family protein [Candidatus Omnitrophica bacterium]|nr:inorganic phosphate transporter family protein [Candidatus Omnitrophota bacterium]MBU1808504.1 inorganic phosphate transporter family protein [Candidatus Omnitrophota bacterium]
MIIAVTILVSVFLAMNMGISGFSVSFAPSFGSNVLRKNKAALLYGLCVIAGACLIGPRVVETLVRKISYAPLNVVSSGIILISCAITMFLSNVLKVPQSTSFVTVASFVGSGLFYGKVNWYTVEKILVFAVIFSIASFGLTVIIKRRIYPPRQDNLGFYEKFFVHRDKFKKFIIFHDMYAGFSVGTNNVANIVAPLVVALGMGNLFWFLVISPLFGLGAYFWGERMIRSVSRDIVPVGEFSASIVSFITATFVLIASFLGLPTPYVQFTTFSLLGISCVKDGFKKTSEKLIVKKMLCVWILVPLFTVLLSFSLHLICIKYLHL